MLGQILQHTTSKHPKNTAVVFGETRITYACLEAQVENFLMHLTQLGIQTGDRIAMLLPNCPGFLISFFALAKIGAIAVPLNPAYKTDELAFYFNDCHVKAIITTREFQTLCERAASRVSVKICSIVIQEENADIAFFNGVTPNASTMDLKVPFEEVLYQYSSGSTGRPKRIGRTHANLASEAYNFTQTVSLNHHDKILCVVPLFHAHGFGNGMLASLYVGATLVLLENFNPHKVIEVIQKERISVFPAVPFMYGLLLETFFSKPVDFSSLRLCISAGAPLPIEIARKFKNKFGIFIRQLYGMTEGGAVTINLCEDIENKLDAVGLPLKNIAIKIIDENLRELPPHQVGEIIIKSPAMCQGDHGLEAVNQAKFKDGWFFSGDLGRLDEAGNLYLVGRKKRFINTAGLKVDPVEVENVLLSFCKVSETVVLGVPDRICGEVVKAFVVPKSKCTKREILDFCRQKLADFKVPRIVEFRDELPKSSTGKILTYLLDKAAS